MVSIGRAVHGAGVCALVVGLVILTYARCGSAETFTAVTHFKSLVNLEEELAAKLHAYISAEERQLEKLKQLSREVQAWSEKTRDDFETYLGHPTNAFRMVRRFTTDWRQVEDLVSKPHQEQEALLDHLVKGADTFPDEEDLSGAMVAFMRLQDVYHVNTTQFAAGMAGPSRGAVLSIEDLYLVARSAYNKGEYANSKKWMQEAVRKLNMAESGANATSTEKGLRQSMYDHLAFAEFKLGNLRRAYRLTKLLLELEPGNSRYLANKEHYYEGLRHEIKAEMKKRREEAVPGWKKATRRRKSISEEDYRYWQDYVLYKKLCREPIDVRHAPDHQLICFFNNNNRNPRLILRPARMEITTVNPTLVIFRDTIFDSEIELLKNLSNPLLNRATAHNRATGRYEPATYRISKSAWLGEYRDKSGVLARVNQRIEDITGLAMSTAEELQVVNYGIGGHYEPHFDHARTGKGSAEMGEHGNRIATLLFYLSDVTAGGCTVFPRIPARVVPSKGDATFWYNLLPSGNGDDLTRHAGCPVLSGSKWVCNKWIHEHHQELRKPCKLTEDATWDLHIPPEHV